MKFQQSCISVYKIVVLYISVFTFPDQSLEPGWLSQYSDGLRTGRLDFDSRSGEDNFLFPEMFRLALGPTQPHTQWPSRALSPGSKLKNHEADHSPPSGAEVRNVEAIPLPPPPSYI
jgi:hypothetical protein